MEQFLFGDGILDLKNSKNIMKRFLSCFLLFVGMLLPCNAENRWHINSDGSISWSVKENDSHKDHIEMSGLKVPQCYVTA